MSSVHDLISFWGSIASLAGFAIVVIGGFCGFLRWGHKLREDEFRKLSALKESIAVHARSATTQGKRLDLFIYYQSLLSGRRFAHIVREIAGATIHLGSVACLLALGYMEPDARYYMDRLVPTPQYVRDTFHYIIAFETLVLCAANVLLRYRLAGEYKRIRVSASGLTDELESFLHKNDR